MQVRLLPILCLVFVLSACAGHRMALTKGQSDVDVSKKSIALVSAKISNQYKPAFQLDIITAYICPPSQEDCSRARSYIHKISSDYRTKRVTDSHNEYLLSFELESGAYNFDGMGAIYESVFITGGGVVPLKLKFQIGPNAVIYLGHLDIVMRERKNDSEMRAGRMTPLIDQAVIGVSSGTFDVLVEDKFAQDQALFISEYPALQKVKIEKSLLPQWTRPKAD